MTEATEARLAQIIELSRRVDTPSMWFIRELAERALADERSSRAETELESLDKILTVGDPRDGLTLIDRATSLVNKLTGVAAQANYYQEAVSAELIARQQAEATVAARDAQIAALQAELADFRRGQARHLSKMRPAGGTPAAPQKKD